MKKTVAILLLVLVSAAWGGDRFQADMTDAGTWNSQCYRYRDGADDALIVWAVASDARANGKHAQPDWLINAVDSLASKNPQSTLTHALRICALAEISPLSWRRQISQDAAWLVKNQARKGAWGETPKDKRCNSLDTAWAVYALSKASQCGAKVSPQTWQKALEYFKSAQNSDGGFGYEGPDASGYRLRGTSHGLTTAAATMAMEIIGGKLALDNNEAYGKAIAWFGDRDSPMKMHGWLWGRKNRPMAEYRFFLAMATGDFAGVAEAGKYSRPLKDSLAEDKLIADALGLLISARAKSRSAAGAAAIRQVPMKPVASLSVDILADEESEFTNKAIKTVSNELTHAYSQAIKTRQFDSTESLSPRSTLTWWTRNALPNQAGQKELYNHMAAGGIVLFDLGTDEGYKAVTGMLRRMFGKNSFITAEADSEIMSGNFAGNIGIDISTIAVSPQPDRPALTLIKHNSRLCAIISSLPLAKSISREKSASVLIKPENATRIAINLILFAQAQKAFALRK